MTMRAAQAETPESHGSPSALSARGIGYAVRGIPLLTGIDLDAAPGTLTGVVGPNGAGKSTLLRVLSSARRPTTGCVFLRTRGLGIRAQHVDIATLPRRERARRIALVEQETPVDVPLRVREVAALGRTPHHGLLGADTTLDTDIVDRSLERLGLTRLAERRYDSLSGGERQRTQLARALVQDTEILLLDEPTNHLDVHAQLAVLGVLRERAAEGLTAVAALHDLGLAAAFCDRIVILSGGRVTAAGAPREVLTEGSIAETYGVEAAVLADPVTGVPVISYRGILPGWTAGPASDDASARARR